MVFFFGSNKILFTVYALISNAYFHYIWTITLYHQVGTRQTMERVEFRLGVLLLVAILCIKIVSINELAK